MSTSRRLETFGATLLVAALTAGSFLAVASVQTAAAAPAVVASADFQDGTLGGWTPNGGATPSVVSLGRVLQVADRATDYDGVQLTPTLSAGTAYTFSMRVRLAADVTETTAMRFVVGSGYDWVGDTSGVNSTDWTTVSGSYTPTAGGPTAVYLGTADIPGRASYGYLVDELVIATGGTELSRTDFEDGTLGGWQRNGAPSVGLAVVEDRVLSIPDRANTWDSVQQNLTLTAGTEYQFSYRIRLADGVVGTTATRFIAHLSGYDWIGNTTGVSAAGWTRVSGSYTPSAAGSYQLYPEVAGDIAGTFGVLLDDIRITTAAPGGGTPGQVVLSTDFESGLDGWGPRADANGTPTVALVSDPVHGGTQAAAVTDRVSQGSGIGHDVTGLLEAGVGYELTAWLRFAPGEPADDVWLSLAATTNGVTEYKTVGQFTGMSNSQWVKVTQRFTAGAFDTGLLYFETKYSGANTSTFFLDDVEIATPAPAVVQDLTPIKDTVAFPVGVAIDSRETVGSASELLLRHVDQLTAENAMKPEAWYDATGAFAPSAEADGLMDYAQQNGLRVYGHVLVWHSQTPAWFFESAPGVPLTSNPADQAVLEARMRTHIFDIAAHLAGEFGEFGSAGNPLVAFDVVNEVVADSGDYADGLRRSEWYRVLGERFIDLAFQYADEAFNHQYAASGSDRPVKLFINDYNTEQSGKQQRYHALVERLLARHIPVDGVGHQFHVSLSMPVATLGAALDAFAGTGLLQAVTELDVTTGTPVTQAKLVDQGYYYRDAFRAFRAYQAASGGRLFSVTVWGLTDGRSWRNSSGAPLVFDDALQAKPAYYGIVDDSLPAPLRTADVFRADVPAVAGATSAAEWARAPLHAISSSARFQLRWEPDHLTVFTEVDDTTAGGDAVAFELDGTTVTLGRDGTGSAGGVVAETATGYRMVVRLPLSGAQQGDTLAFDVRVTDGATTSGWNAPGATGTLTLLEPLSFLEVVQASAAPAIDGTVDAVWDEANVVTTSTHVQGTGAEATVRTLWRGSELYVLAEVADPVVDVSGSDPWVQDSVEIYVDPGNVKNGSYRYDDSQIRISAANVLSFGTGDEAFQRARVRSATATTDGGYVVEAAIMLGDALGLGTFQGLDFQVNDASGGTRTGISNWADPSGAGYQSTARWGVGELVGPVEPEVGDPTLTLGAPTVRAGGRLDVELSGFEPGTVVSLVLDRPASAAGGGAGGVVATMRAAALPTTLGTLTIGQDGTARGTVAIPADTTPGAYRLAASAGGTVLASGSLTVLAALASTGADAQGPLGAALLLLLAGVVVLVRSRRRMLRR